MSWWLDPNYGGF